MECWTIFVFASSSRFSIRVSCQVCCSTFTHFHYECVCKCVYGFIACILFAWRTEAHKPYRHSMLRLLRIAFNNSGWCGKNERMNEWEKNAENMWTKRGKYFVFFYCLLKFHSSKTVNFRSAAIEATTMLPPPPPPSSSALILILCSEKFRLEISSKKPWMRMKKL